MIQLHLLDVVCQSCSCDIDSWKILFLIHASNPRPRVLVALVVAAAAAAAVGEIGIVAAVAIVTIAVVAVAIVVETELVVAVAIVADFEIFAAVTTVVAVVTVGGIGKVFHIQTDVDGADSPAVVSGNFLNIF